MMRSALAGGTLPVEISSGSRAKRMWLSTGPPFWARPVMSRLEAAWPSTCAAMASTAATVVTPVPPTPVNSTFHGSERLGVSGIGRPASSNSGRGWSCQAGSPSWIVTKLGQKPRKQERSVLQVDWLMRRLRPSSVSTGSTDRQLDLIEQSPQPSQTSVLMTTRVRSGARRPRLDRRRFSVAQI